MHLSLCHWASYGVCVHAVKAQLCLWGPASGGVGGVFAPYRMANVLKQGNGRELGTKMAMSVVHFVALCCLLACMHACLLVWLCRCYVLHVSC